MPKFKVKVIVKSIETYEVEADDQEQAEDNFCEGILIDTDDNIENEILEVSRL